MRRLWIVTGTSAAVLSVALACSSFDAESPPPADDGGPSDAGPVLDAPSEGSSPSDASSEAAPPVTCVTDAGLTALDGGCAELIASGQEDPRDVVVPNGLTSGSVFWTTFGSSAGTIMKSDLDGANATTVYTASAGAHVLEVAIHGTDLVWGEMSGTDETQIVGAVYRRKITPASRIAIATNIYVPRGIAVTDDNVFFSAQNGVVVRADYTGVGAPATLATGRVDPRGVDLELFSSKLFVAIAGNDGNNPGNIQVLDFDGGGPTWQTPVSGAMHTYPWDIVVGTPDVYWSERGALDAGPSGSIYRAQRSDGGAQQELCHNEARPTQIALDNTYVYFLDLGTGAAGELRRVKKDGSQGCEVLASGLLQPGGIDVDPPYVYWTTRGDGRVWRMKVE